MTEVRKNEAKVVGQRAQKVLPCVRCLALGEGEVTEGVAIRHATPVESGGHPTSEWNQVAMCSRCEADRRRETEEGILTVRRNGPSRRGGDADSRGAFNADPERGVGRPGIAVAVGDHVFGTLAAAAKFLGTSAGNVSNWAKAGARGVRFVET